ncbi:MAG: type VI secretion system tip protein VgrG, partial [Planctomycetes bacterium]|nr:type VI secretion system tip protein VgrG [Planctomycetota bacterium]
GMDQMYATQGYVRLPTMDFRLQNRIEKVVVYAKTDSFGRTEVTHAAKQERILTPFGVQGVWTSKLGALALIQHTSPHSVNGPAYGQPVAVYARFV